MSMAFNLPGYVRKTNKHKKYHVREFFKSALVISRIDISMRSTDQTTPYKSSYPHISAVIDQKEAKLHPQLLNH